MINAFQAIEQSLRLATYRQQAISQNIANADTPHYKSIDVSFESQLQNAIQTPLKGKITDSRHFTIGQAPGLVQPHFFVRSEAKETNNENDVDLDQEMTALAKNTVYYQTIAQLAQQKFGALREVIQGGR